MSGSVSKIVSERNHRTLLELALKPGNDVCADCKARAPRWASYSLGIFICVSCASIHRKIGTHVTKVKSITLDEWTKDQVEVMKENGNVRSNALYNPNEARHPPPANMMDSERDSELEKFIRSKYEYKRFMDRKTGSTQSAAQIVRKSSPGPLPPPKTPQNLPQRLHTSTTIPSLAHNTLAPPRSASQPLPPLNADKLTDAPPLKLQSGLVARKPTGEVWEDLISLRAPSHSSSLPLQYSPLTTSTPQPQVQVLQPPAMTGSTSNPFINLSLAQTNATMPLVATPMSVSMPGTPLPFVSSSPLSSPALYVNTNPFNQAPPLLPQSVGAGMNIAPFPPSSNPFSPSPIPVSMAMSAPTTPIMALTTGSLSYTPSLPYAPRQPSMSFPPTPSVPGPGTTMAGVAQNPLTPAGVPGQIPLPTGGVTNPFSAMQMGQAGFSGTGTNPQQGFVFLNSPQGFGGWVGQAAPGTY